MTQYETFIHLLQKKTERKKKEKLTYIDVG